MVREARGGRGGRGGRGRGRGGSSAARDSNDQANTTPATIGEDAAGSDPPTSQTAIGSSSAPSEVEIETTARRPVVRAPASSRASAAPSRAPVSGRFRPKAIRRDEAGRESLAQQELAKDKERAAADAKLRRSRGRGRLSRGRGRGGRDGISSSTASGPFSQFSGSDGPGRQAGRFQSLTTGSSSRADGTSSRRYGDVDSKRSRTRNGDFTESGPARINADKLTYFSIDQESDSEDEFIRRIRQKNPNVALPVSINRIDQRDQQVVVATTAELEAQDSLYVDGASRGMSPPVEDDNRIWGGAPGNVPDIKREPGTDADPLMDFDKELKKQMDKNLSSETPSVPVILDREEILRSRRQKAAASELEHAALDSLGEEPSGHILHFMLPPILPPLHVVNPASVKQEDDDDMSVSAPAPAPGRSGHVDLTADDDAASAAKNDNFGRPPLPTQGGRIGKLTIRKSGKVELDWGGRILTVTQALPVSFATTAMIAEEADEKPKQGEIGGRAYQMGQVWGAYSTGIILPEEEDWVISSSDDDTDMD